MPARECSYASRKGSLRDNGSIGGGAGRLMRALLFADHAIDFLADKGRTAVADGEIQ